jgi:hypothetical protein
MNRVPSGVTEVEYKRAFSRLEQQSNRRPTQRAEAKSQSTNMDAAALQLDMSRRFNLGGIGPRSSMTRPRPRGQQTRESPSNSSARSEEAKTTQQTTQPQAQTLTGRDVTCMSCLAVNLRVTKDDSTCYECGFFLDGPQRPAPPSLAQRRGLVQPTPQMDAPVLRHEWDSIEAKLSSRLLRDASCPICMEGFNQGSEVLLSCSHIFHRRCLESFESFMGKGEVRSCPLCRKPNYQKKITRCGTAAWEAKCATLLQAAVRGFLARKYVYDSGAFNIGGKLRHRHLSREITVMARVRAKQIDRMVGALDATLDNNRELDLLFERMLRSRQSFHEIAGEEEALPGQNEVEGRGDGLNFPAEGKEGNDDAMQSPRGDEQDWPAILAAAKERGLGQCSICLGNNKGLRGLSLLSCSHIMHNSCLSSFKRFAKDRKVGRVAHNTRDYMPQAYSFSHLSTLFFLRFCRLCFIFSLTLLCCPSKHEAAHFVGRPSALVR